VVRTFILAAAALALGSPAAAQQAASAPKPVSRAEFIARIDQSFKAIDTNHDGFLSAAEIQAEQNRELQNVRAALSAKLRAAFNQLDTNKDGQLSFAEFSAQTLSAVTAKSTAQQLLQQLDTNHDGKVSAEEFRNPKLPAFDKADLNHDGIVTPEEERRANGGK
jgi:Ca2+-binding EF-hand superfamily protein